MSLEALNLGKGIESLEDQLRGKQISPRNKPFLRRIIQLEYQRVLIWTLSFEKVDSCGIKMAKRTKRDGKDGSVDGCGEKKS